ncbi:MAG: hypothetical protein Q7J16_03530 [Candidatus Cloacimonadales bacterium]|nr:hypothetical protein [Candidatus Cloacimonadales bacterium]
MKKMLFFILFSLFVVAVYGQFHYTPPPMPMHDQFMMTPTYSNPVYRCKIYLSNGEIVEGESSVFKDVDGGFYLKIKKQKYEPFDTDSVFVNQCHGMPKGDHWLFETVSGKLSVYNKYPTNVLNSNSYITKRKGQYTPYDKSKFILEIEDNSEALAMYQKINKTQTTAQILTWGGVGVVIISFLTLPPGGTDKDFSELPQSKLIIGGAVLSLVGYIVGRSSEYDYFDVIEKYNE